jgi:hypothetical protein
MKRFVPVLVLFFVLVPGSFAWVQAQRTSGEKNGRETEQRERLKRLLTKVGVEVPERDVGGERPAAKPGQALQYRELKIRWGDATKTSNELRRDTDTTEQTQSPAVQAQSAAGQPQTKQTQPQIASVVEDKRRSGALPRQRSVELSPTHIFIAAVDATNKLRWWSIVPDPRVVRSETQTATGEMRGEDYYVSNVTLVVAFPDDPEIANLRFYHPVWNGSDFDLKPLTNVPTR